MIIMFYQRHFVSVWKLYYALPKLVLDGHNLTRGPGQLPLTKEMKMHMPDSLTAGLITIVNNAKTFFSKAKICCNLRSNLKNMPHQSIILYLKIKGRRNVFTWNQK